jgi:serine/threonine protein kinase
MVMKKYNMPLVDYLSYNDVSMKKVLLFAKEMISAFKYVHETGFVYNNLKMENIMIGSKSSEVVKLIDYSKAQSYLDNDGNHLERTKIDSFESFSLYASLNTLNLNSPSRKDDLISLCYMLFMIINDG